MDSEVDVALLLQKWPQIHASGKANLQNLRSLLAPGTLGNTSQLMKQARLELEEQNQCILRHNKPAQVTELPKLNNTVELPLGPPKESWDEYYSLRAEMSKLVSQQSIEDQDVIFDSDSISQFDVLKVASTALTGYPSHLLAWDERQLRIVVPRLRIFNISLGSSMGYLQYFADAGSYVRRLEYAVCRIRELDPGRVAIALCAAIQEWLAGLMFEIPQGSSRILDFYEGCQLMVAKSRTLTVLLGNGDLTQPSRLSHLPSSTQLINRAYHQSVQLQADPRLGPMLWDILQRVLDPWIEQLNWLIGGGSSLLYRLPTTQLLDQLPDMFVSISTTRQGYFVFDSIRAPEMIAAEHFAAAVECLNCAIMLSRCGHMPVQKTRVVLGSGSANSAQTKLFEVEQRTMCDAESAFARQKATLTKQRALRSSGETQSIPPWSVHHTLADLMLPVYSHRDQLYSEIWRMLDNVDSGHSLMQHVAVFFDVVLLQSGVIFTCVQDFVHSVVSAKANLHPGDVRPVNDVVSDVLEGLPFQVSSSVTFEPEMHLDNLRIQPDLLAVRYVPPGPIAYFFTPKVIARGYQLFSKLIRVQFEVRAHAEQRNFTKLNGTTRYLIDIGMEIANTRSILEGIIARRPHLDELAHAFDTAFDV